MSPDKYRNVSKIYFLPVRHGALAQGLVLYQYRYADVCYWIFLKVPKCEIFDGSDCHNFYTIKSPRVVDFGVKINNFIKYLMVHLGPQSSLRACSLLSQIFWTKISF
jgi:hypothetical protein